MEGKIPGPCILPTPDMPISFIVESVEVGTYKDVGGRQSFYCVAVNHDDLFYNVPALAVEFFDGGAVAAFRIIERGFDHSGHL